MCKECQEAITHARKFQGMLAIQDMPSAKACQEVLGARVWRRCMLGSAKETQGRTSFN